MTPEKRAEVHAACMKRDTHPEHGPEEYLNVLDYLLDEEDEFPLRGDEPVPHIVNAIFEFISPP